MLELEAIAATARETWFVVCFGRKVLEALLLLDANKGTAVRHLLAEAGLDWCLAAGDDTTPTLIPSGRSTGWSLRRGRGRFAAVAVPPR